MGDSPSHALAVEINGLGFTYRNASRPALRGLDFHQRPCELVGVMGATGAGKSTFCRSVDRIPIDELFCTPNFCLVDFPPYLHEYESARLLVGLLPRANLSFDLAKRLALANIVRLVGNDSLQHM